MGSFARPKNGDPEAGKKPLPELRPGAVVASPPMWKGSPEKRPRLEALRDADRRTGVPPRGYR